MVALAEAQGRLPVRAREPAGDGALPDPVRARLKEVLDGWSQVLRQAIVDARTAQQFRADIDPEQIAFELHGLYLGHHFFHWYQKDRMAEHRTMKAFERLVAACR